MKKVFRRICNIFCSEVVVFILCCVGAFDCIVDGDFHTLIFILWLPIGYSFLSIANDINLIRKSSGNKSVDQKEV